MSLPPLELVSHPVCPYVQRAAIVLAEKGVAHRRTDVDLKAKPDWFKAISPLGRVPLLRAGDHVVFESAVICEYLDEVTPGSLHPADPLEKARHRAWIEFASETLNAIGGFYSAPDQERFDGACQALTEKFAWLEDHLGEGPYFSGTEFSLVDAAFGPVFRYFDVYDRIADFGLFDQTPKVRAYRLALAVRPSVRGAVGPDYGERLQALLRRKETVLSGLLKAAA
ncbi:MAG: glutathione S-transferase family protein [Pseudomonadota bacterium]